MPRVLCIDEIRFTSSDFSKYACIISDFETRTIIDICFSRRLDYLNQYFSEIPLKERENVQIFISDMYDGYATVCKKFFPNAIHIVDLFHVVSLLTTTINMIRNRVQNLYLEKGSPEYNFMSSHWRFFVCRYDKIPSLFYKHKKTNIHYEYANIFNRCLNVNSTLCEGYNILQELLNYSDYYTFEEALNFVNRIVNKLQLTGNELLKKVAKSYHKWRYEIANGFNKRKTNFSYSNAVAENLNNHIKTLIKCSYGLRNPERMRKRILYIEQNKKA